jgi:hypothetical protein
METGELNELRKAAYTKLKAMDALVVQKKEVANELKAMQLEVAHLRMENKTFAKSLDNL